MPVSPPHLKFESCIRWWKTPEAEGNDLIRVIDESGEDYLYPARLFQRLSLPSEIQRALRLAS